MLQIAKETKEALFKEWEINQYFTDYNNFFGTEKGLLSEAMGLTGTMLMLVAFHGEESIFPGGAEDPQLQKIITSSLNYIYDDIQKDGYTVAPLRSAEDTKALFNQNCSYTDTLTWVLSASVLMIYAIREKIVDMDEQMQGKAIALVSDSLARILDGQLECGAWGFSTDHGCKPSLYFTYTVATSLADFMDYILGELEYYSDEKNLEKDPKEFYDWEVVNAINTYYKENLKPYFPKDEMSVAVEKAKAALQDWLLKNCFPLLPKIAACTPLTAEEMEIIGVAQQTSQTNIKSWGNKDFLQLYYAYYIIDILTTSSADQRFKKIVNKQDPEITVEALRQACEGKIPATDLDYFFGPRCKSHKLKDFFQDYIDQSIHSVRYNHSIASRTGDSFWKGYVSELIIPWEHNTIPAETIADCRGEDANARDPFTEPALIPMALRANTIYCYYIIEQADITVDNLFDAIVEDRSAKSGRTREGVGVQNLWDGMCYNLAITERAIEAIVDYSDYIKNNEDRAAEIAAESAAITSIDDAIEKKIAAYLRSENGTELIRSLGYAPADEKPEAPDIDQLVEKKVNALLETRLEEKITERLSMAGMDPYIVSATQDPDVIRKQISALISDMGYWLTANSDRLPQKNSSDNVESLLSTLFELWEVMDQQVGRKRLLDHIQRCGKCDEQEAVTLWTETLSMQVEELFTKIIEECTTPSGNVASIYRRLLTSD